MKHTIALLLCLIMMLALVACGGSEAPADTSSQAGSDVSSDTENTDSSSGEDISGKEEDKTVQGFDPEMDHIFLATDVVNHSVVVYDLSFCEGDFQRLKDDDVAIIWEWDADDDPKCKGNPGRGIDAAKYRYSGYYERDVVVACSSNGWCGVIDYDNCSLLWEYTFAGGGPHSIEMIPNGDVVVGVSGDPGAVAYIPLSAGITKPVSSFESPWCHGVSWDPVNEWIWVLVDNGVYSAVIENMGTAEGTIKRVGGTGDIFDDDITGGHAFTPIYGEPGKYWVSSSYHLWQFDSETEELTRTYNRAAVLTAKSNIKGIASFPDGTVVETVAGFGGKTTYDWSCGGFRIITQEMSTGKVQTLKNVITEVFFDTEHRDFYKVHPFTKDYQ